MTRTRSLTAALCVSSCISLAALAPTADAAVRTLADNEGRPIRFDVRAPNVNVVGYRNLIASLVHGDEIEDVTFRIVPPRKLAVHCLNAQALACYSADPGVRPAIVVPARRPGRVVNVVTHEYGHHIDRSYDHRLRAPDFDGTARWWAARKMARLLRSGDVAWDYRKGWGRSLAEIFAEDYAVLNQPQGPYDIYLLKRPGNALREALRADIVSPRGLSRQRLGPSLLRGRAQRTTTFAVGAARPTVVVTTRVRNPRGAHPIATSLSCGGATVRRSLAGRGRVGIIRMRNVGPADCTLTLSAGNNAVLYESTIVHKKARR